MKLSGQSHPNAPISILYHNVLTTQRPLPSPFLTVSPAKANAREKNHNLVLQKLYSKPLAHPFRGESLWSERAEKKTQAHFFLKAAVRARPPMTLQTRGLENQLFCVRVHDYRTDLIQWQICNM